MIELPSDLVKLFTGATNLDWFYSPSEERYYSLYGGELHGRIRGKYLPDPSTLFEQRCIEADIDIDSAQAQTIKPTDDAYRLWNDWINRS